MKSTIKSELMYIFSKLDRKLVFPICIADKTYNINNRYTHFVKKNKKTKRTERREEKENKHKQSVMKKLRADYFSSNPETINQIMNKTTKVKLWLKDTIDVTV